MEELYKNLFLETHYPLTIVSDRYGGTYSGGEYTAWPDFFYNLPKAIEGDDIAAERVCGDGRA